MMIYVQQCMMPIGFNHNTWHSTTDVVCRVRPRRSSTCNFLCIDARRTCSVALKSSSENCRQPNLKCIQLLCSNGSYRPVWRQQLRAVETFCFCIAVLRHLHTWRRSFFLYFFQRAYSYSCRFGVVTFARASHDVRSMYGVVLSGVCLCVCLFAQKAEKKLLISM